MPWSMRCSRRRSASLEILRVHLAEVLGQVGHPALVLPTRLEQPELVRVGAEDDLHHREPLLLPVGRELLEAIPAQPLAQPLPPGVAEP